MTSCNGQAITYDAIGNPLTYRDGMQMTWEGRELSTLYTAHGLDMTFSYDGESGLYYVSSRYYDPKVSRWINADSLFNQESVLGNNMFAYCLNNPVNMTDETGNLPFLL